MIIQNAQFINVGGHYTYYDKLPKISKELPEFSYYGWVFVDYYVNTRILQNIFIRSSINNLIIKKGHQISLGIRKGNKFHLTYTDKDDVVQNFSKTGNTSMQHGVPAWYHFGIVATTSEITNKTTIKFYINGKIETFTEKHGRSNIQITNVTEIDKLPIKNSDLLFLSGNTNNQYGITLAGFNFENKALTKKEITDIMNKTYNYTLKPSYAYSFINNDYCLDNNQNNMEDNNFILSKCDSKSEQLYRIKNVSNNKVVVKKTNDSESCVTNKNNMLQYNNCNEEDINQQFDLNYNHDKKSLIISNQNKCFDFSDEDQIILQDCESESELENSLQKVSLKREKYVTTELITDPFIFSTTKFLKELPVIKNNRFSYYGWINVPKRDNIRNRYHMTILKRSYSNIYVPYIMMLRRSETIRTYLTYKESRNPALKIDYTDTTKSTGWIHYALSVDNNKGTVYINGKPKEFEYIVHKRRRAPIKVEPHNPNGTHLELGDRYKPIELAYWNITNFPISEKMVLDHMKYTRPLHEIKVLKGIDEYNDVLNLIKKKKSNINLLKV
jgi:hypothetical protein